MSLHGVPLDTSGVDLIVNQISGRSRFVFSACQPETRPPGAISSREFDAEVPMGGSESKSVSALSNSPSAASSPYVSTDAASPASKSDETPPMCLEIRVVGIEDDRSSVDICRLRSCLKRATAGSGADNTGHVETPLLEEDGRVEDVETESPELSILQDTAQGMQKKRKSKKGAKLKKEGVPTEEQEACRRTTISWGSVHVRSLVRMVGGSSCVPEHSGNEWVLGLSDQFARSDAASDSLHAVAITHDNSTFDSDGEEEIIQVGLVSFASTGTNRFGFSPKHNGKAVGSPKMQSRRQQGSPRSVKAEMPSPCSGALLEIDMAPLTLGDAAIPSLPAQRRRTIPGASMLLGTVDQVEHATQARLQARYRTLSDKERSIFKVEKPYETRQFSHKKIPDKTGNPLFKPLSDRQRADIYCRDGTNTKDDMQIRINNRQVRVLDAINASRARIGCQCRNLQAAEVKKWTVKRLHLELSSRGLDASGTRHDMVDRIVRFSESVPTCKHDHLQRHCEGSKDVIPGEDGPFILLPDAAIDRAAKLQEGVFLDNVTFFSAAQSTPSKEGTVISTAIGENICPCAVSGIGCIDDCRCLKYGCSNRTAVDNTAYAYDSESVREIIAEVLARHRRTSTILFTHDEMQATRELVLSALRAKKRALLLQAAEELALADREPREDAIAPEVEGAHPLDNLDSQATATDVAALITGCSELSDERSAGSCGCVSSNDDVVGIQASDEALSPAVAIDENSVEVLPAVSRVISPETSKSIPNKPSMSAASMDFASAMAAALAAALAANEMTSVSNNDAVLCTPGVSHDLPAQLLPHGSGRSGRGRFHNVTTLRHGDNNALPTDVGCVSVSAPSLGARGQRNRRPVGTRGTLPAAIHPESSPLAPDGSVIQHVALRNLEISQVERQVVTNGGPGAVAAALCGPARLEDLSTLSPASAAVSNDVADPVSRTKGPSLGYERGGRGGGRRRNPGGAGFAEPAALQLGSTPVGLHPPAQRTQSGHESLEPSAELARGVAIGSGIQAAGVTPARGRRGGGRGRVSVPGRSSFREEIPTR